jgi:hypothetical protein
MPMHDWTIVPAGIFHAFHHGWISALSNTLNAGMLPDEYYALLEQQAAGCGPDVLTFQDQAGRREDEFVESSASVALVARPQTRFVAESGVEVYRRKKSSIAIRHVSGDRILAKENTS